MTVCDYIEAVTSEPDIVTDAAVVSPVKDTEKERIKKETERVLGVPKEETTK